MTNTATHTAPTTPFMYRGEPIHSTSDLAIAKAEHLLEHLNLDDESFDWAMDRVLDGSIDLLLAVPLPLRVRARNVLLSYRVNVAVFLALIVATGFLPRGF